MNDWATKIPLVEVLTFVFIAGGVMVHLRQLARSVRELADKVEKLGDSRVKELEGRVGKLEVWASGHEQQATERWRELHEERP